MELKEKSEEWFLFIDSSTVSLKAVLLGWNQISFNTTGIACSMNWVNLNAGNNIMAVEWWSEIHHTLYWTARWIYRVSAFPMSDSRATHRYICEGRFVPGRNGVKYPPLVDRQLAFPPVVIKMGLIVNIIEASDKNRVGLKYLKNLRETQGSYLWWSTHFNKHVVHIHLLIILTLSFYSFYLVALFYVLVLVLH